MEKNIYLAIIVAAVLLCAGCANPPAGENNSKVVTETKDDVQNVFSSTPAEYMVEYENTVITDKDQANFTNAIYYRGKNQMRMDSNNPPVESRFYINTGEFIMCNNYVSGWACTQMEGAEDSGNQEQTVEKDTADLKKDIEENKATKLPDRVIAGVTCKCYNIKISYNIPQAQDMSDFESTYCISPEGIPLYTESKNRAMHSIRQATKYSTHLTDADFTPPAKVMTMEEYLQSGGEST